MFCRNCGAQIDEGSSFCRNCGENLTMGTRTQFTNTYVNMEITEDRLPEKFRPLGAWAYFGYSLLFAIPLVGFICLIVFSFNDTNINRRNFARSFWCILVVILVLYFTVGITALTTFLSLRR